MRRHPQIRITAAIALLALLVAQAPAAAGGLTTGDYRYLVQQFGLAADGFVLKNIAPADAAKLHHVINAPERYKEQRDQDVADSLFDVEMRTCQEWQLAHSEPSCPMVSEAQLKPGWQLAEARCIACHLTGTTSAPSFFKLAEHGAVDEHRLAAALAKGHRMSPISLQPQEIRELALYINSLGQKSLR